MKMKLLPALAMLATTVAFGQTNPSLDLMNTRDGENVEYCITHKKYRDMLQNPDARKAFEKDEERRLSLVGTSQKATVYYIPVVFHVLHYGGNENISDEQIMDALDILNRDFAKLNADTANIDPEFVNQATNADIQFRLATKTPGGNYTQCFDGITRTYNSLALDGSNGGSQVQAIVNGNDTYNGSFPGDRYLNIFIVGEAGGAAGYTYTPSGWVGTGMDNGIWILHNYVGSIGTGSVNRSRALTHEVGHWLNLPHPWGGTNNPGCDGTATSPSDPCWDNWGGGGAIDNCDYDDGVDDTPTCRGVTACLLNENSCDDDNGYWGYNKKDNVENYMDYSYCSKMFTAGQVQRMRDALAPGATANRDQVISQSNLDLVGANGVLTLCAADFSADVVTVCTGGSIQFEDESYNSVNGWTWTFDGGTPNTSTDENPVITYNTPGIYNVTLEATDGVDTETTLMVGYVRVLTSGAGLPHREGFEQSTTLQNTAWWEVVNTGGNAQWEVTTAAAHSGSKCATLQNFAQPSDNEDELVSSRVDLSTIDVSTGVTMSFRYAYRKRASSNNECLKVFISGDCGDNWAQRKTLCNVALGSDISGTNWTATSGDWETVHMLNVTDAYWTENFRYKFLFESDGGNNIYLDDINIYSGGSSDDIVVGLEENGLEIESVALFPNPADEQINVRFTSSSDLPASIVVQDVSGKILRSSSLNATTGSNLVLLDTDTLSQGVYFLKLQVGSSMKTMQFVVK